MVVFWVAIHGSRRDKTIIRQDGPVYMTHSRAKSFTKIFKFGMLLRDRYLVESLERGRKNFEKYKFTPTIVLPSPRPTVGYFTTARSVRTHFVYWLCGVYHTILCNPTGPSR